MQTIERAAETFPDADLLKRFAASRDEAAFAELVRRHGRLVWGVCRRRLDRREDAEDAFQVTFLILAVKVRSIREPEALAGWLHRTATRTALRLASASSREIGDDTPAAGLDAFAELARKESVAAVDEELVRLPRRYRDAVVLFHLEGLDRRQVAERLAVSEATVKALLARGRSLLRSRLARRGIALPLLLPLAIDPVPASLAASAGRSAVSIARTGLSPFDLVSVSVKGLPTMFSCFTNKTAAAALAGAVCLSLFLVARGAANADGRADASPGAALDTALVSSESQDAKPISVAAASERRRMAPGGDPTGNWLTQLAGQNPSSAPPARTREVAVSPAEERILKALDSETELVFPNTPLRTALEFLGDVHGINIIIDETGLTDEGISIDDTVDITLKDISLKSGLNVLLKPSGLTYVIRNEVMMITTQSRADGTIDTQAYDVSAFLQNRQPEQVAELVTQLLAPLATTETGGTKGPVVVPYEKRLIVTGTWSDHARIREILDLMQVAPSPPAK